MSTIDTIDRELQRLEAKSAEKGLTLDDIRFISLAVETKAKLTGTDVQNIRLLDDRAIKEARTMTDDQVINSLRALKAANEE